MAAGPFLALRGDVVLVGKRPDGDSVRFRPDRRSRLEQLERFPQRGEVSEDGTVQLRLEGIDAPERGYQGQAQPRAAPARDALLRGLGFTSVRFDDEGTVTAATPATRPAIVLSRAADADGRPVAYLLTPDDDPPADGEELTVPAGLVRRTRNARLLADGLAYLTLYTSTPGQHRRTLRSIAAQARERGTGVWGADRTGAFTLTSQRSVGPNGVLVLPKLFRRCTDYLRAREDGFRGTLPEWLRHAQRETGAEDDEVIVGDERTRLSALVRQEGDRITVEADLLALTFVER